jgi:hypothetical protein
MVSLRLNGRGGVARRGSWWRRASTCGTVGVEDGIWVAHDCFGVEIDCFVKVSQRVHFVPRILEL